MEIKTDDESNGLCGSQLLLDRRVIVILTINHTNAKSIAKRIAITNRNGNAKSDRIATLSTCPMEEIYTSS